MRLDRMKRIFMVKKILGTWRLQLNPKGLADQIQERGSFLPKTIKVTIQRFEDIGSVASFSPIQRKPNGR